MLRVALIGLGKMGLSHLAIFRAHPEIEIVAVCDPAKYVLGPLSHYTGLKTFTDYNELLDKEELDAVVVATPSRFHGDIVRKALEQNIHVFCEKPFCLDAEEGASLARLAREKGLVGQVGYHYRFVGAFREVKRLLEKGLIGRPHNIRAEAYGPVVLRPKGSTWRSSKSEGGGCLYDYASHALDLMNYLVGPPSQVRGTVINRVFSRDVDDEIYTTLFYENGLSGQLMANWSDESFRKMSMKINIWGEAGRIQADRQEVQIYMRDPEVAAAASMKRGWNVRYTTDMTEEVWYYLRGEEYSAQVEAFVAAIQGDPSSNISPFDSAVQTDGLILRLIEDAEGSREIASSAQSASQLQKSFLGSIFRARR